MSAHYSPDAFSTSVFALNTYNQQHAMNLPTPTQQQQQYQHLQHLLDSSAHALSTSALDLCVRKRRHQSPTPVSPPRTDYQPPTPPSPCHVMLPTTLPLEIKPPTHDQNESTTSLMDVPSSTSNITCYTSSSPHSNSGHSDSSESLDICGNDGSNESQQQNFQVTTSKASKVKVPRPFKAYPKDPLSLTLGVSGATANTCSTEGLLGLGMLGNYNEGTTDAYSEFRNKMLRHVQANYSHGTNKNMRRTGNSSTSSCSPGGSNNADMKYLEMRRKNNEAAKRSRDARRAKEDEIAIRCAFLEQENLKLRYELAAVKTETDRLRGILAYSS